MSTVGSVKKLLLAKYGSLLARPTLVLATATALKTTQIFGKVYQGEFSHAFDFIVAFLTVKRIQIGGLVSDLTPKEFCLSAN